MKKILLSSIVLLIFASSTALFQISCKKVAEAQTQTPTSSQLGKIIYGKSTTASNNISYFEVWIANYDGTNKQKINISLPADTYISGAPHISPDGKTIFLDTEVFSGGSPTSTAHKIYSCNADGSSVKEIASESEYITVGTAY